MNYAALHSLKRDTRFGADVRANIFQFLLTHDRLDTYAHCCRVAAKAKHIALVYGLDPAAAELAGLLHDISAVVPNENRIQLAEAIGLNVLEAERKFPMIVHQRLSEAMALELFGVTDSAVLSAIGCHTTLKRGASHFDKAVFVADKIKWDQPEKPPYLSEIERAVAESLDRAAWYYLDYLFKRSESLRVVHPWAWHAYTELGGSLTTAAE